MNFPRFQILIRRILNGDLKPFGGPNIDRSIAGRVRAERIDAIVKSTPRMMLGNVLTALVLVVDLFWTPAWISGVVWGLCVLALAGWGFWRWAQKRSAPRPAESSEHAMRIVVRNASVLAGLWALAPIMFLSESSDIRLIVACLVAGMMSGGFALATVPAAMIAFEAIFIIGSVIGLSMHGELIDLQVGVLLCVYSYVLVRTAISHAIMFSEHVVSRIEGERQRDVIGLLLREFETNASDWLWELDEDLRVRHASARLLDMLGRSLDEIAGQSWRAALTPGGSLLPHNARMPHAELARLLLERRAFRDQVVMVHVQEEARWWSITAKPIHDSAGAFRGYRRFGSDITAMRRAEERIDHMSRYDSLTGLPNRRVILEETEKALARFRSRGQSFAALVVDIDRFRQVNELFGRRNGDDVLMEIGERLSTCLRDGDVLGRMGGDLFGILRSGVSATEDLVFLTRRLKEAMSPPFIINGVVAECTISIGITIASADTPDAEALLQSAEQALDNAKRRGAGSYHFFEPELDLRARETAKFEAELRSGVERREIEICWRPVVDVETLEIKSCHARLRWRHPELGVLPEEKFLPAAESAGLAGLIGAWKLREVCAHAAAFTRGKPASVVLTRDELEDPGTVLMLARALERSRLRPSQLEVRVPEELMHADDGLCLSALKAIARMGVGMAAIVNGPDARRLDFPEELAVSRIVFGPALIDGLGQWTQRDRHPLEASVDIVAQGVSSARELELAKAAGCANAEGDLFGQLLSGGELADLLELDRPFIRQAA